MITDIKSKIVSLYFRRKKLFNILGVSLFVFVVLLSIFLPSKNEETTTDKVDEKSINKTVLPSPSATPNTFSSSNEKGSYYINQIVTNFTPVTGYSWKGNKLIYSTSNGIYEAGTNIAVSEGSIERIIWSDNFHAIFRINGKWNSLDYGNKKANGIEYNLSNPKINDNGSRIVDFQKNKITLYNLIEKAEQTTELGELIEKTFFVPNSEKIIVLTSFGNKSYVYKLDNDLKTEESITFDGKYDLSSISKNGESFVLTKNNELVIANFSGILFSETFTKGSSLTSVFNTNFSLIIVEKYKDGLGRTLDNIFLSDLAGKKNIISNSNLIPKRINSDIPLSINTAETVVSFAENGGKIWILALKVELYPTYSTSGELVFSNIKTIGI